MRYLELLPGHDTCCADFIRLNPKSAIFVIKHVSFLSKYSWQEAHDRPTQKSSVCSCIASIEKGIVLFRMTVQIAIDPNMPLILLFYLLHQLFDSAYFWMEAFFRIDPLTI